MPDNGRADAPTDVARQAKRLIRRFYLQRKSDLAVYCGVLGLGCAIAVAAAAAEPPALHPTTALAFCAGSLVLAFAGMGYCMTIAGRIAAESDRFVRLPQEAVMQLVSTYSPRPAWRRLALMAATWTSIPSALGVAAAVTGSDVITDIASGLVPLCLITLMLDAAACARELAYGRCWQDLLQGFPAAEEGN